MRPGCWGRVACANGQTLRLVESAQRLTALEHPATGIRRPKTAKAATMTNDNNKIPLENTSATRLDAAVTDTPARAAIPASLTRFTINCHLSPRQSGIFLLSKMPLHGFRGPGIINHPPVACDTDGTDTVRHGTVGGDPGPQPTLPACSAGRAHQSTTRTRPRV
jgi:hypothetical protein